MTEDAKSEEVDMEVPEENSVEIEDNEQTIPENNNFTLLEQR